MSDTESRNIVPVSPPVRGRPFAKGNPGKPRGARNHASRFLENLKAGDAKEIVAAMVEKAKLGNVQAAELILSRLAPIPKGRKVAFEWPVGLASKEIGVAFDAVLVAVGQGILTPDEASLLGGLLEKRARVLDTDDIVRQIAELREAIEKLRGAQQ